MSVIRLAAIVVLLAAASSAAETDSRTDANAQAAHATGLCGSLGPGSGLRDGKGWVVSMLPGRHQLRVRGAGTVNLTVAKLQAMDFDAGRPYYITLERSSPNSVLEWKTPGSDWAPIPRQFLYPP